MSRAGTEYSAILQKLSRTSGLRTTLHFYPRQCAVLHINIQSLKFARHLRGTTHHLRGNARHLRGSARHLRGNARHLRGSARHFLSVPRCTIAGSNIQSPINTELSCEHMIPSLGSLYYGDDSQLLYHISV